MCFNTTYWAFLIPYVSEVGVHIHALHRYGIECHMPNSVSYPILGRMLGYTKDQQLYY